MLHRTREPHSRAFYKISKEISWELSSHSVSDGWPLMPPPPALLHSSPWSSHNETSRSVKLCISVHPVILRPGPRRMDLRDRMNMTGWYFHRMLLLLQLVAYMLAYNDTDHCQVCQTPVIQNPRVPWHRLINNTTYYFSGLKFRSMIWVLPKHSFVSGPYCHRHRRWL